jgi:hypothetical protein
MSEEITDIFNGPDVIDGLKVKQILKFKKDDGFHEWKITRVDRKNHRVWAIPVKTYEVDELAVTNSKGNIFGRKKRMSIDEHLLS